MPEAEAAPSAWRLAWQGPVVRRALFFAVVVGPLLIAINHGDALLVGELGSGRALKMGLTFLVPYLVSTLSSVATARRDVAERRLREP